MANIREIQSRINSVKDTMKITNAMYMISSSKMTHAKKKLADTEPYFYGLQGEISRILRHLPDLHHGYFSARENVPEGERKIGSIVITADKGLAGAYNHRRRTRSSLLCKAGRADRYQFSIYGTKSDDAQGEGYCRGSARPVQGEGIGRDLYCLYEDGKFCSGRSRSNEASSA